MSIIWARPANGGCLIPGENHLSFIETSALDASNVELAFQNILTGMYQCSGRSRRRSPGPLTQSFGTPTGLFANCFLPSEIYRIVSSKALDSGDGAQATIGAGTSISLSKPADDSAAKKGGCCGS